MKAKAPEQTFGKKMKNAFYSSTAGRVMRGAMDIGDALGESIAGTFFSDAYTQELKAKHAAEMQDYTDAVGPDNEENGARWVGRVAFGAPVLWRGGAAGRALWSKLPGVVQQAGKAAAVTSAATAAGVGTADKMTGGGVGSWLANKMTSGQ
jgi:hypothetical protein